MNIKEKLTKINDEFNQFLFDITLDSWSLYKVVFMLLFISMFLMGWISKKDITGTFEVFIYFSFLVIYFIGFIYLWMDSKGYFFIGFMIYMIGLVVVMIKEDTYYFRILSIGTIFIVFMHLFYLFVLYKKETEATKWKRKPKRDV